MKTATCALVADTSKFDGPIDQAKAKLSSFGQAISATISVVERTAKTFDRLVGIADGIISIKKAFDIVKEASSTAINAMKNFPAVLEKIKSVAGSVVSAIKNIHPAFLALGAGALTAAGSVYVVIKALQGVASVSRSAVSSIKNISSATASVASKASSSIWSGFSNVFKGIGSVAKGVGLTLGGLGISFGALDRFFKIGLISAVELGDSMKNLSARTGASIPFLVDMQKIFKNSGISADYAGNAMLNMQRSLSGVNADGEPTNKMFERLGLSVDELIGMSPEKQFKAIGSAIANLRTESERTAASFAIFGRQGGGLKAVFKDPAFAQLGTNFSSLGLSIEKNADNFSKISAKLRDSGSFFRGFFVEMAGAVAPSILEVFKLFEGEDKLAGFGKKIGDQIALGANALIGAFKSGELLSFLKSTFEVAGIIIKDILSRSFRYASEIFSALLSGTALPELGSGLIDIFSGAVKALGSMLLKVFETPLAYFQAGLEISVAQIALKFDAIFNKFAKIGEGFAKGGATGAAIAATKLVFEPTQGLSDEEKRKILTEKLEEGVKFGIAGLEISSRNAESSLGQIGTGVKKLFNAMKIGGQELSSVLSSFPDQSEDAKNALIDLSGKAAAFAVAGRAAKGAMGGLSGSESLLPLSSVKDSKAGQAVVSSLQRIGGGGGAFGGKDPMVQRQDTTNSILREVNNSIKKLSTPVPTIISAPKGAIAG